MLGSPPLDHELQQAVMQLLALGMEQARPKVEAAAGGSGTSGQVWGDVDPVLLVQQINEGSLHRVPQLYVFVGYVSSVQRLLQHHGGRLLTGGDPATAMQLVAMLRGMAAAHIQVRRPQSHKPHVWAGAVHCAAGLVPLAGTTLVWYE